MMHDARNAEELRAHKQFIEEIQRAILEANRKIIGERIPDLTKQRFFDFAVSVARLRARYLEAVLKTNWEVDSVDVRELRDRREVYEEALRAFEALERLIERGYVHTCRAP